MSDDDASTEGSGHAGRWLLMLVLLLIAAAAGRKIAIDSADRAFEARLAELDANRD